MDPANSFSRDVALITFSHLDIQGLRNCMQVCQNWHKVASEDSLWRLVLEPLYPQLFLALPKEINVRQYFQSHSVKTLDDVIKRIETFMRNSTKEDHKQSFTCFFPKYLPGFIINVEFGFYTKYFGNSYGEQKAVDSQEFLAFMGKIPLAEFIPGSFSIIEKQFSRDPLGIESHLDVKCKLTTEVDTVQCIEKIGSLHDAAVKPLEEEHIRTLYSHQQAAKKKKPGCILA